MSWSALDAARAVLARWEIAVREGNEDAVRGGTEVARSYISELAVALSTPQVTEQAGDPRDSHHFECDCIPELGPPHCHACGIAKGRPVSWEEGHAGMV